jgi:hypothetical protein
VWLEDPRTLRTIHPLRQGQRQFSHARRSYVAPSTHQPHGIYPPGMLTCPSGICHMPTWHTRYTHEAYALYPPPPRSRPPGICPIPSTLALSPTRHMPHAHRVYRVCPPGICSCGSQAALCGGYRERSRCELIAAPRPPLRTHATPRPSIRARATPRPCIRTCRDQPKSAPPRHAFISTLRRRRRRSVARRANRRRDVAVRIVSSIGTPRCGWTDRFFDGNAAMWLDGSFLRPSGDGPTASAWDV